MYILIGRLGFGVFHFVLVSVCCGMECFVGVCS